MITEVVYQKRLLECKANLEVYKEVTEFLKAKQEAVQKEADALNAKEESEKTREDYEKTTDLLVKSVSYLKLLNKLQDDKAKMLKNMDRIIKQYDFQHRGR